MCVVCVSNIKQKLLYEWIDLGHKDTSDDKDGYGDDDDDDEAADDHESEDHRVEQN